MELGQERGAGACQRRRRAPREQQRRRAAITVLGWSSDRWQSAREPRFSQRDEAPVVPPLNGRRVRQERRAQRRRHHDGDGERRQQRHDVGERQRREQASLHAGQAEDRQEHRAR